jgi:hypothetical protein
LSARKCKFLYYPPDNIGENTRVAGRRKYVWLDRANEEAKVWLEDSKFKAWLLDTKHSDEWYTELKLKCAIRRVSDGCFYSLVYYCQDGELPTKMPLSSPVTIWSPSHHVYGNEPSYLSKALYSVMPPGGPVARNDRIYIEIHPETSRADMDAFMIRGWPIIEKLLPDLGAKRRYRSSERIIRNIKIQERRDEGASYTELVKEFNLTKRSIEKITKEMS